MPNRNELFGSSATSDGKKFLSFSTWRDLARGYHGNLW